MANEAADLPAWDSKAPRVMYTVEQFEFMLRELRVSERRATVERIRVHLLSELPAPMAAGDEVLWSTVVAILDEEAK